MRRRNNTLAVIMVIVIATLIALITGLLAIFSDGYQNWDVTTWKAETRLSENTSTGEQLNNEELEYTVKGTIRVYSDKNMKTFLDDDVSFYSEDGEIGALVFSFAWENYTGPSDSSYTYLLAIGNESFNIDYLQPSCSDYVVDSISSLIYEDLASEFVCFDTDGAYLWSFAFIVSFEREYTLPENPTKEGHTFTGWYTDEACTQAYTGTTVTEDTTLYAGWEIHTFTVKFVDRDKHESSITVDWNTVLTDEQLPTLTREGYTFTGWGYDGQAITEDTTLTAEWEQIYRTVTFIVDGEVYKSVSVPWGSTFKEAITTANVEQGAVYSVRATNEGENVDLDDITTDITVDTAEPTELEKTWDNVSQWFIDNWVNVAIYGGIAVFVLGTVIICIIVGKRR